MIKLDPEHKKIALSIKEYLVDKNKYNRDDIVVGAKLEAKNSKEEDKDKEEDDEDEENKRSK